MDIEVEKQIYDCLIPDVTSHDLLKQKLIEMYPNKERPIKGIFEYYGF
jgi:hypothetical protein